MGKYGEVANQATSLIATGDISDPIKAWDIASKKVFPNSESSRTKSCPRSTFLGLCEAGYVSGVEIGTYTRSKKNKAYALSAIEFVAENPRLLTDEKSLWSMVVYPSDKKYNSQMDVVISLWNNGHIVKLKKEKN